MPFDSSWFFVKLSQETVPDVYHKVAESEEDVALLVLRFNVLGVLMTLEADVDDGQHFVHALGVLDARIQFGVDEQDLRQHVRVGPDVVVLVFLSQVTTSQVLLLLQSYLVFFRVVFGIEWLLEEAHLRPGSLDVLVDFVKGFLVAKVVVPHHEFAFADLALIWSVVHRFLRPNLKDLLFFVLLSSGLEVPGKLHLVIVLHTYLVARHD